MILGKYAEGETCLSQVFWQLVSEVEAGLPYRVRAEN
jgi:hypothetical protein